MNNITQEQIDNIINNYKEKSEKNTTKSSPFTGKKTFRKFTNSLEKFSGDVKITVVNNGSEDYVDIRYCPMMNGTRTYTKFGLKIPKENLKEVANILSNIEL